ncbi:hypothetical protein BDF22DRAFT_776410 [Syncephalis plumigaleata]|nr:hypothetical protein BDF22DRAFT_776410 [Syncephalis plumigaleata]
MDTPTDMSGGFRGRGRGMSNSGGNRGMSRGRGFNRGSFGRGGSAGGGSGTNTVGFSPVYPSNSSGLPGSSGGVGTSGAFSSPGRRPNTNPAGITGHASLTSITGIDMGIAANTPFAPPTQNSSSGSGSGGSGGHRLSAVNVFETTPSRWELEQRAKVAVSHAHIASPGTYYPRVSRHNNPIIPGLPRPKEVVNVVNVSET